MDESETRLDGNALAGELREIFARDMTSALACCASCGNVGPIGEAYLYMAAEAPGGVLRCRRCESVLLVYVNLDGRRRLGTPGLRWMEMA